MSRGRKFGNDTIDVANKGCWEPFDSVACARSAVLATVAIATLVLVLLTVARHHIKRLPHPHHYAIFYISVVECAVCATSSLIGSWVPQVELVACFIKLLGFALVCHLYWSQAARSLGRPDIVQHVINPILCLYVLYCITVALMGMVDVVGTWLECQRPYWLMLSVADFLAVQIFSTAALFIMQRTEGMASLTCIKHSQHRYVWSIILGYEVSAILSLTFDIVMKLVGSADIGCSGVFGHKQIIYSAAIFVFALAKFMVPIWTLLCVLRPPEDLARPVDAAHVNSYNMDGILLPICPGGQYLRMNVPPTTTTTTTSWAGDTPMAAVDLSFPDTDSSTNSTPNNSPLPMASSNAVLMRPERLSLGLGLTSCTLGLSTISEESAEAAYHCHLRELPLRPLHYVIDDSFVESDPNRKDDLGAREGKSGRS